MGTKIVEEHFDINKTNERFTLFLIAHKIKPGDSVEIYEFQIWISKELSKFKGKYDLSVYDPISKIPNGQELFTKHLKEVANIA
ncbi:hypothetical protein [Heyndrickxia sporothermodurans]|uniref:hypothetical protein n=1 Tax=Heyndrickxia sporothermodurans TaxID=46224 RepID=UPI002E1F7CF2|nr:hypothetical protein [Heyndrickxia sporothermodurans]MED3697403.1 hypothetical protein [Heyndrickxia sporothermodurans]